MKRERTLLYRFDGGKSASAVMYDRNEEYIMSGFYVEKLYH